MPMEIFEGLIQRGLPEHVALAFMDNFVAESGLNPQINEVSPLVEGSRGGRGLYQLTGPRRTAYEQAHGTSYDIDSQLDWLMYELQGPEARAAEAIFDAPDRSSASHAIASKFLRPLNVTNRAGMWNEQAGIPAGNASRAPKAGMKDVWSKKRDEDEEDEEETYTSFMMVGGDKEQDRERFQGKFGQMLGLQEGGARDKLLAGLGIDNDQANRIGRTLAGLGSNMGAFL